MAELSRRHRPHAHTRGGRGVVAQLVLAVESVRCICGRLTLLSRVRGQGGFAQLVGRCRSCRRRAFLHVEIEATP